jgi:hypothetical protein
MGMSSMVGAKLVRDFLFAHSSFVTKTTIKEIV